MPDRSQSRFTELLEQHRKIVLKVASLYCWHEEDRRDLTQDITMQLWRAFARYDDSRTFSTWMYRIALNVAISSARKRGYRNRLSTSIDEMGIDPVAPETSDPDARVRALYHCMARLDPLDRALLTLYLDDHSYRDIADVLGISETNVATKISRLKHRLRRELTVPQ